MPSQMSLTWSGVKIYSNITCFQFFGRHPFPLPPRLLRQQSKKCHSQVNASHLFLDILLNIDNFLRGGGVSSTDFRSGGSRGPGGGGGLGCGGAEAQNK